LKEAFGNSCSVGGGFEWLSLPPDLNPVAFSYEEISRIKY
jgi:hypothetical protein